MPKKEVFLSQEILDHIVKNHKSKYSEYIREAVEERYNKEAGKMTNIKQLEERYGSVEFKGKKYVLCDQADFTNRLLDITPNHNNPDEDGNYYFELAAPGIDSEGTEVSVYWIFKTEEGKELDEYDYDNVDRVIIK